MSLEDKSLILRAQAGDKRAFAELMRRYGERVMNQALRFTRNIKDAEDLCQETFLKVYRNLGGFRFESEFYTWVYRIMANIAFSQYRRKKRFSYLESEEDSTPWDRVTAQNGCPENPIKEEEGRRLKDAIYAALSKLSAQQRIVFIMKHYEGKKIREIAELLECSEGTVKRYLFRAVKKLQSLLKPYYEESLV